MKILFAEIPEEGLSVEIDDQAWFPDHLYTRASKAAAHLFVVRKGGDRVLLRGRLLVDIGFSCDRCLEDYVYPLDCDFSVDFELLRRGEFEHLEKEHDCSESEMDVLYIDEPRIDVFAALEQQVHIAIPGKRICLEECKGLCTGCGANLNKGPCDCAEDVSKTPFGVLARLKK